MHNVNTSLNVNANSLVTLTRLFVSAPERSSICSMLWKHAAWRSLGVRRLTSRCMARARWRLISWWACGTVSLRQADNKVTVFKQCLASSWRHIRSIAVLIKLNWVTLFKVPTHSSYIRKGRAMSSTLSPRGLTIRYYLYTSLSTDARQTIVRMVTRVGRTANR